MGGGCSGFSYDLYFEDKPTDMDETFEANGVNLYIDPLSYQYLDGTEIDYVEGMQGSGFKFSNPNVKGTCGCGSASRPEFGFLGGSSPPRARAVGSGPALAAHGRRTRCPAHKSIP